MQKKPLYLTLVIVFLLGITLACRLMPSENVVIESTLSVEETLQEPTEMLVVATVDESLASIELSNAGFSYMPVEGYESMNMTINESIEMSIFHNNDGNVSIYMFGETENNEFRSTEDIIIYWMNILANNDQIALAPMDNYGVIVDGHETLGINLLGESMGKPAAGQVVAVYVSDSQYFMMLGFSEDENAESVWQEKGQPAMDKLLAGVKFLEKH